MRGARPQRDLEARFAEAAREWPGGPVAVACSGGADSVALAALTAAWGLRAEREVLAVHVNHGTRRSAAQDELVAVAAAAALALPLAVVRLDPGPADEATLRERRYGALAEAALRAGAATLLTAHHARDQTETVLLALFRGTGLQGLAGMPAGRELRPGLTLARPLLSEAPEALRRYAGRLRLPYAADPTNEVLDYRRNRLRAALAGLRPGFPNLDEAVARCARLAREELAGSEGASRRRAIYERLRVEGAARDLSYERLAALERAMRRPGRRLVALANGAEAIVEDGRWRLRARS
jgi:tRNA(Ile)-lysidine synthase